MTALIGVFGPGARTAPAALPAMLGAMPNRTREMSEVVREPGVFIAAGRHVWEAEIGGWTGPLLHVSDDWIVAGDATLYYLRDLRRRLDAAGRLPRVPDYGALVRAALDTWGERFARYVEGDYALIIHDRRRERTLLVRDSAGKRPLAWTRLPDRTLVVASSPNAVVAWPGVSADYDLGTVVGAASGFYSHGVRTSFAAVKVVAAGQTLAIDPEGRSWTADQWEVPPFSNEWAPEPSEADADQLRALLEDATCERLPDRGVATIWMSGGSDSTAVFAAGRAGLARHRKAGTSFLPVSLSLPESDKGYEDDVIREVAEWWQSEITWIPIDQISLFAELEHRVAVRDDAMTHSFESMLRRLMRESRSIGARVALDGIGGDHLFHVSDTVIADHIFFGRWGPLLRSWKARRGWPLRELMRLSLLPQLSDNVLHWIGDLRGRPLRNFWDAPIPAWVRPFDVVAAESRSHTSKRPDEGAAEFEVRRLLTTPQLARVLSWNHGFGLDEGIQVRSPLLDRRLVEFAATRPVSERNSGRETKVLLRRSMRELLPSSALKQSPFKKGTMAGYFERQSEAMKRELQRLLPHAGRLELDRLGLLDTGILTQAVDRYRSGHEHYLGAYLYMTLETERWLAWRAGRG